MSSLDGQGKQIVRLLTVVFALYFVTGAALPVLPIHVRDDLGFGPVEIGLVTGAQFGAAVFFRIIAGALVDRWGPRVALFAGCMTATAAGLVYALSLLPTSPGYSLAVLLLARALLGAAESFVIVGGQSWGLMLVSEDQSGRVIGWIGTALFLGLAAGAPAGSLLFAAIGFPSLIGLTAALPVAALFLILPMQGVSTRSTQTGLIRELLSVGAQVWLPGAAMCLSTASYGVMIAFSTLLFAERGWHPVWLSFTIFAVALTLVRLLIGGLPDRFGGAQVAIASVVVQATGMAILAFGASQGLGFLGAALAGAGYALVYPSMGLVAIGQASKQSRGAAIGIFSAFLDLSLGISAPAMGAVAAAAGLSAVFVLAAVLALAMVPLAWRYRHGVR